ncbi:hypothetical protein EJ05DRAFT_541805 [Pseudovirgaria hyperparasitica]|uniref:Uncharacterized protein n=1 Tax=Pseudovirgaria hyperparasitica TaxID=470096 RepID=A0A6A6VUC8_9PEZI|nr:uncharacterized protein EJ05DRAFT_541805 [Pseudovirgaria hyperparasitica]KAF2753823.1 hypothetical protein EJ05DRAFT_541805 [Pseudovirgaria hyperparasitica]
MRSQLTRLVFHRILSNQPIPHTYCANGALRTSRRIARNGRLPFRSPSRAFIGALFNMKPKKPERHTKEPTFAPGVKQMASLSRALQVGSRPAPDADLTKAFDEFFALRNPKPSIRNFEILHVTRTFDYLKSRNYEPFRKYIHENASRILYYAAQEDAKYTDAFINLGRRVYELATSVESEKRHTAHASAPETTESTGDGDSVPPESCKIPDQRYSLSLKANFFHLLLHCGAFEEAKTFLKDHRDHIDSARGRSWAPAVLLMAHLRRHNMTKVEEIWTTLKQDTSLQFSKMQMIYIARTYTEIGDITKALSLFPSFSDLELDQQRMSINDDMKTIRHTIAAIIEQSWMTGKLDLVEDLVRRHVEQRDSGPVILGQILAWAAASGKNVEELERMMRIMKELPTDQMTDRSRLRYNARLLNALLEYAVHRKDAYLAERYMGLADRLKIIPSDLTYILQATWRLDTGDIEGAKEAVEKLRVVDDTSMFVRSKLDPLLNRYLEALTKLRPQLDAHILEITEWLASHGVRFEPATTKALCLHHLRKDEFYDVIDLLQTNVNLYSVEERTSIWEFLSAYALDKQATTNKAWDVYMILQRIFEEMHRDVRTQYMVHFYARMRPDLALHVFNHMRRHRYPDCRSTIDTYVKALTGIAETKDATGLLQVFNQLKLDDELDPNTRLYNALMLAHGRCGNPDKAFNIWNQIADSREGPSYQSIVNIFRVCEYHPAGDEVAASIWRRLRRYDIELDVPVVAAFVGTLARHGRRDPAYRVIQYIEKQLGLKPDVFLLASLLNKTVQPDAQKLVMTWIENNYSALWAEMKPGLRQDEIDGLFTYPVDLDHNAEV